MLFHIRDKLYWSDPDVDLAVIDHATLVNAGGVHAAVDQLTAAAAGVDVVVGLGVRYGWMGFGIDHVPMPIISHAHHFPTIHSHSPIPPLTGTQ